jgi:hypothetical protein
VLFCFHFAGVNGLKAAAEFMRSFDTAEDESDTGHLGSKLGTSDPAYIQRQVQYIE